MNCIKITKRKYSRCPISLPWEVVEKQYGKTMKEAANSLDVSLYSLKRQCKILGISKWPGPKFLASQSGQDISHASMNNNTLTIKAKYADIMVKFNLPISQANFVDVDKEIGMRLKLGVGTYKLKYLDEDGDWIPLISDEGMSDCIKCSRKLERTLVRLEVLPSTQPISNPSGSST